MDQVVEVDPFLHFDLRETWQYRTLVACRREYIGMIVLSVLAHTYDEAMPTLLRAAFPGFQSITAPFLCTAGKVDKQGRIVADVVQFDGTIDRNVILYRDEIKLRDAFRRLADRLKLNDKDRIELFKCVQRWVVADMRLDPVMDPKDPDAKRLVN